MMSTKDTQKDHKTKAQLREEERQKALSEMETMVDIEEFVVLDCGSGLIKAGFSGEDTPRIVMPNIIVKEKFKSERISGDTNSEKINHYFGKQAIDAQDHQINTQVTTDIQMIRPVKRGFVENPDDLKIYWEHIFTELCIDPSKTPIMLVDCPLNARDKRQKLAEILFEDLKIPTLGLMNSAALSLFSTGRTRGCVLEVGDGVSHAVPIFEGQSLPHAIQRLDVSGSDITEMLRTELQKKFKSDYNYQICENIKEKMCEVSLDYSTQLTGNDPLDINQRSYELPDSNMIEVNQQIRQNATEILFKQELTNVNTSASSIHGITQRAIDKCDNDLLADLWGNIVLSGGTTLINDFDTRLKNELINCANMSGNEINIIKDSQRQYAPWIGASMLASLDVFAKEACISKNEYDEGKHDIVHKKCFN